MRQKSSLLIIFLVVFIDLVSFGIVLPILPFYSQLYGGSAWHLGWLMTSYSLMQFLIAPLWGRVSDFVGRRPVILISVLGTAVSMTVLGIAGSLQWLFIGRILAGIFGANITTAYAYIVDVTTEDERAKGMGLIGAAFGLAFIFGPAIGGMLSRYGYGIPMFVGAILALCNFIFALLKLEEPHLSSVSRSTHRYKRFDFDAVRLALADGRTRFAIALNFMVTFALVQLEVTLALYMGARYQYDAESVGVLLAVLGLLLIVVQTGVVRQLSLKYGERNLILTGTAMGAAALAIFPSTSLIPVVLLSLCLVSIAQGLLGPSLASVASMGAPSQRRGSTMGVFQSAGSIARLVGPPCAGWLFDHISWRSPYFGGSFFLIAAFVVTIVWSLFSGRRSSMYPETA